MDAQPALIGTRADGSLLGELEGKLYSGTKRKVGYDLIERSVEETDDAFRCNYHVNGYRIGGETFPKVYEVVQDGEKMQAKRAAPPPHEPKQAFEDIYIRELDGSITRAEREVTMTVIDWSPL